MDPQALIDLLSRNGLLEENESIRLSEIADSGSTDIFAALEASGCGEKNEILKCVAELKGLEFLDLRSAAVPPQLLKELPQDVVRIYRCFPTSVSVDSCKVCMVDPLDEAACAELSRLLGKPVEVAVADPDLVDAIVRVALEEGGEGSALVDATRTAPVAASLGAAGESEAGSTATATSGEVRGSRLLWSLSLLAVATVALAALYLGQKRSPALSDELKAMLEENSKNAEFAALATQKEFREIEGQIEELKSLLEKNEVDAIALQQLQDGLQRMEGKIESIENFKSRTDAQDQGGGESDAGSR